MESWIQTREPVLNDDKLGESIWQVEELIRKHEDFEKTIEAQEEKFNTLKRITLVGYTLLRNIQILFMYYTNVFAQLELAFKEQLETEERARVAEKERLERERLEARKQREVQRITDVSLKTAHTS